MIKIENVDVYGWEAAIRGARNPMNSWDKSDSEFGCRDCRGCYYAASSISGEDDDGNEIAYCSHVGLKLGPNDHKLLQSLANAGPDHGKFLRMIVVYCDITGPLYWYKELDTYRMGVEKNSCSTMHKIHSKPFEMADFSHDKLNLLGVNMLKVIVDQLEANRLSYLENHDKRSWWQLIQLLPSAYNQRRTYMFSYAALRSIYHARKNHKLDCWRTFCDFIKSLPHSELITGGDE